MKSTTLIFIFFFTSCLIAQTKNITSKRVQYESGNDTVYAYLSMPEEKDTFPAIILIHEWWGLNDWMKQNARSFARYGYAALAIDLYRGRTTTLPDEARKMKSELNKEQVSKDVQAAFLYLRQQQNIIPAKIGAIGWCMGGEYSLKAATIIPELASTVVVYGELVKDTSAIRAINCPMLGIFGEADGVVTPAMAKEFGMQAHSFGKQFEMEIYPNARHAFMNPNNETGYSVLAASEAWIRIFHFLEKTVSGKLE
ncbi:MAG: dienelactone hydrolase family protein [Ignavibacteriae bacterium]|nr:dienelactone hydrolase family protein [Ignavibacteriota bacterium]